MYETEGNVVGKYRGTDNSRESPERENEGVEKFEPENKEEKEKGEKDNKNSENSKNEPTDPIHELFNYSPDILAKNFEVCKVIKIFPEKFISHVTFIYFEKIFSLKK